MKPEWCPQEVWQAASVAVVHAPEYTQRLHEDVARALLEAHQRGRREGMEEAIAIALDRSPDDDNLDWQVRQQVAAAIRAKIEERHDEA